MAKYLKNLKVNHVPLEPGEAKLIDEGFNEYMEEIKETGELLKQLREEKGWTQKQLGQKVGIEEAEIEMMETAKTPIPEATAKKFGEVFQKNHDIFLWR